MLNQRQLEILLELMENDGRFMVASHFTKKHAVSLRTVQGDMKAIRAELQPLSCIEYDSAAPKGSRIRILDAEQALDLKNSLFRQYSDVPAGGQEERVRQILLMLLRQRRAISMYDVESSLYISRSTLTGDLRNLRDILSGYHLELLRSSSSLLIDGKETDKRRCILEEKLFMMESSSAEGESFTGMESLEGSRDFKKIKEILVRVYVSHHRQVSEVALNNTLMQLFVMLRRMENYFFIDASELPRENPPAAAFSENTFNENTEAAEETGEPGDEQDERAIAEELLSEIGRQFLLRIPQTEKDWLTLYLKGKSNYSNESGITQELNDLVLEGLREIRASCGVDLTDDVQLRISLGLHMKACDIRIRHDMQLDGDLSGYIRRTYPQGYDIATYFSAFLQQHYGKKIKDEETALLAIHLYKALNDLQERNGTRKVLVISSLRRSENILLRQTIMDWFHDQIAELYFVFPDEMDVSFLDRYDTFFTTEKGDFFEQGLAVYIHPFPDRQDCLSMKLVLDGFTGTEDMMGIFREDLFFLLNSTTKEEALQTLCEESGRIMEIDTLYEDVLQREEMGASYFGSGIAAPHPHTPSSSVTFIAVGYSPVPLLWDETGNKVRLVLLTHIGRNNPHAFKIWNYLSRLMNDASFMEKLAEDPSFDRFLSLTKSVLSRPE